MSRIRLLLAIVFTLVVGAGPAIEAALQVVGATFESSAEL